MNTYLRATPQKLITYLVFLFAAYAPAAKAQLNITEIPFGPSYGSALRDFVGAPVELTDTSFLVEASGPDLVIGTADDLTLLVNDVSGSFVVTPIATPYLWGRNSGGPVALSATRALVANVGVDGVLATGDETVYLLDDLGGTNSVTVIPIGYLRDRTTWKPIRLSDNSAAIAEGIDHTAGTTIKLLTDLGGSNNVTTLPAPFLREPGGQPVALSPTSLIIPTAVVNKQADASDKVYYFSDLGGANTRTDISTPYLNWSRPGVPVPISANRVILASDGLDATRETADDRVYLVDDLGGANSVTAIDIPFIARRGAGGPVVLNPDHVLVGSIGLDGIQGTVDDRIYEITNIGVTNTTSYLEVPYRDSDRAGQPVPLSPTSFIVVTLGTDATRWTADDSLVVVTDVGTTDTITEVVIGGLGTGIGSSPTRISETAVVVGGGGADYRFGTGLDDEVRVVTGLPDAPVVRSEWVRGELLSEFDGGSQPQLLGSDRAMFLSTGADGNLGPPSEDDLIIVVDLGIESVPPVVRVDYTCTVSNALPEHEAVGITNGMTATGFFVYETAAAPSSPGVYDNIVNSGLTLGSTIGVFAAGTARMTVIDDISVDSLSLESGLASASSTGPQLTSHNMQLLDPSTSVFTSDSIPAGIDLNQFAGANTVEVSISNLSSLSCAVSSSGTADSTSGAVDTDGDEIPDILDACPSDETDGCEPSGSGAIEVDAATGGTLETPDQQLSITIDPADLSGDATISVTENEVINPDVDITVGTESDAGAMLAFYDLETSGGGFASSVTLRISTDVTLLTAEARSAIDIYRYDEALMSYVPLGALCSIVEDPVDTFTANCEAELDQFSLYALITPRDSDGDGVPDDFGGIQDACPAEDATGFDADTDGCIDSFSGLLSLVQTLVDEGVIDAQMQSSLVSKVSNAENSVDRDNICSAVNQLNAFANQIEAQRGKKISHEAAGQVAGYADSLMLYLKGGLAEGESC